VEPGFPRYAPGATGPCARRLPSEPRDPTPTATGSSSSSGANDRSPYSACGTRRSARQERSIPQPGVLAVPASGSDRSAALSDDEREDPCPVQEGVPGFESRNTEKSRSSGPVTHGTPSTTVNATMSGIRISHSFPPQRPLRGLLGERSQRAWRVVDQRNVCCSRQSSTASSTNCQIRPACETQEQRLHHRHVPVAGEPVGERRRNEPGEQRHRERGSRPDRKHHLHPVLRNLYHRRRAVSRKPLVPLLGHFSGLIERG
jgi:hypothetical protein